MANENENKPWVSNYPPLQAWLKKHDARCLWQRPMQNDPQEESDWAPTAYIECWQIALRPFIIVVHANKGGWDLYTACESMKISETLEDAEKRLGLK